MEELMLTVPTFVGHVQERSMETDNHSDFDGPYVPVLIREEAGVRIVLGTHDYDDEEKPDLRIERRPRGWAIFLHPMGGAIRAAIFTFSMMEEAFLCRR